MNTKDLLNKMHLTWKKQTSFLSEVANPKDIQEYECNFRLTINANKTEATLEDILIFVRGINGVTIVRSGDTTKRSEANTYSTRLYIKYTPQTFNAGVSLEEVYLFLEKEIRRFGEAVSLTRLSTPPGELVSTKGQ